MIITYNKPKFVTFSIIDGYTINAFITDDIVNNTNIIKYISVIIGYELSYDNIVSALINYKYTSDQVTAITLNYLLTLHEEVLEPEKVKEYQQDYKELQEYRAACKAEAKRAIEYVEEN
ncbi:MAG: hypothetical protein IJ341_10000 [Bacteroidales bacterium]|nr:hypothetical protein [Bacteroidales bacterium]MBQ7820013.1 hypothetical protein [Bacteroidales bacterium]